MVRVVPVVDVAVAAGWVLEVAVAVLLVGVDGAGSAPWAAAPEIMACSMTRAAVAEGIATPTAVKAAGIARPRNERRMVFPLFS